MNRKLYQSGFSALDAILVVVLVGALAAAGWFTYENMHNNGQGSSTASVSPVPHVKASPTPTVEKGGVLTLTQFSVKLTVPSGLSGLSYTYAPKGTKDSTGLASDNDMVNLISAQLKGQQSTCGGSAGKGSVSDGTIGSISRSSTTFTNMDGSPYSGSLMKKIGPNYYFLGLPNGGPCFTGALGQTETSQRTLIQQAFGTLAQ